MRSTPDPIRRWQRRIVLTALAGGLGLGASAAWTLASLGPGEAASADIDFETTAPPTAENESRSIDPAAFDVVLWIASPGEAQATADEAAAARPSPVRLQLIGIVREGEGHRAILYDPDTDTLRTVAAGEQIGPVSVTAIAADAVEISSGSSTCRLTLDPEDRS